MAILLLPRHRAARLAGSLFVALLLCSAARAAIITVRSDGGGDFTSIQAAIDGAPGGCTVVVAPGEYLIWEPIKFRRRDIALVGEAGPRETIIRKRDSAELRSRDSVVFFDSQDVEIVLEGFTITGATESGVFSRYSRPTIRNCVIKGNSGETGGGVFCTGTGSPTLIDCTIVANSATEFGGGVACTALATTVLRNCRILRNSAPLGGGVATDIASPMLSGCLIAENRATRGGGLFLENGCCRRRTTPVLTNCTITANEAEEAGGLVAGGPTPVELFSCIVWDNGGGSISFETRAPLAVFSCIERAKGENVWPGDGNIDVDPRFCGWDEAEVLATDQPGLERALAVDYGLAADSPCIGQGEGGMNIGADLGVCGAPGPSPRLVRVVPGTYDLLGLRIARGVSLEGSGEGETILAGTVHGLGTGARLSKVTVTAATEGGILVRNGESPEIDQCTITANSGGGIVCRRDSRPMVTNCVIADNSEGGVRCDAASAPVLRDCTIRENTGSGVRCAVSSLPDLTNCAIERNDGSGVHCEEDSRPMLTGCTIIENRADSGGGMHCETGSSPALRNCTITGNSADAGGGIYSAVEATPRLVSCIVWDNLGGSVHAEDSTPLVTFSCVQVPDIAGVWPGEGNIRDDPLFCGWSAPEVLVTSQVALEDVSPFDLALSMASPCLGSGQGGADMGAPKGSCDVNESRMLLRFAPGRFQAESLDLVHGVSIEGAGANETVIEGTVSGLRAGASISHVTVTAGTRGGISVARGEAPEIHDATISGNSGGAINCAEESSPRLTNCRISENSGGGINCAPESSPRIIDCLITRNEGGGVNCGDDSGPELVRCTISGNSGSGVRCEANSSPRLTDCLISRNSALHGGGLFCTHRASPRLIGCAITGNDAELGGGLSCHERASAELMDCEIEDNRAETGGGLYCELNASPLLTACVVRGNRADIGGGVSCFENGFPTLMDCTITRNSADLGGGLALDGSSPILTRCAITQNVSGFGGGVHGRSSFARLTDCTIARNAAGFGGGIHLHERSAPHLARCRLEGNAAAAGGGVLCVGASPDLINCVVTGNAARFSEVGSGGGLFCREKSSPRLVSCTLAGNSADVGGGLSTIDSSPDVTNCIVWGNPGGEVEWEGDRGPKVNHSCVQGARIWPGDGNINMDPLFSSGGRFDFERVAEVEVAGDTVKLPDFIVEAPDYRLRPDSPVVGAASPEDAPEDDIEGVSRPCGSGIAMGAYEYCGEAPPAPTFVRGDCNGDGAVTGQVSDALFLLAFNFSGGAEPPCLAACDADGDGVVLGVVTDAVYLLNFNFSGGPLPPGPFPDCGEGGATDVRLGCGVSGGCGE